MHTAETLVPKANPWKFKSLLKNRKHTVYQVLIKFWQMIQTEEYILRPEIRELNNCIWDMKCHSRGRYPLLYLFIRRAIKCDYKNYRGILLKPTTYKMSKYGRNSKKMVWGGFSSPFFLWSHLTLALYEALIHKFRVCSLLCWA